MKLNALFLSGVLFVLIAVLGSYELNAGVIAADQRSGGNIDNFTQELTALNNVNVSKHIFIKKEIF